MIFDPEYAQIPSALHYALLLSPADKAACATQMITDAGLTLSQANVEAAIDLVIDDLHDKLILSTADYATLLSRHQGADPAKALTVLTASVQMLLAKRERELLQGFVDAATAEWTGLTAGQQAAIPNIKAVGDEGIQALNDRIAVLDAHIGSIESRRTSV